MNNIYLIGMPGCGKTSLGKKIAEKLKLSFIDLDYYLVEKERHTIDDIFKTKGENYFRQAETKYLKEVAKLENQVISTGGGIVVCNENAEIMKNSGIVIFIDTPPDCIVKNSSLSGRPLVKSKDDIYKLYEERYSKYKNAAHFIVDNISDAEKAQENLLDVLNFVL